MKCNARKPSRITLIDDRGLITSILYSAFRIRLVLPIAQYTCFIFRSNTGTSDISSSDRPEILENPIAVHHYDRAFVLGMEAQKPSLKRIAIITEKPIDATTIGLELDC